MCEAIAQSEIAVRVRRSIEKSEFVEKILRDPAKMINRGDIARLRLHRPYEKFCCGRTLRGEELRRYLFNDARYSRAIFYRASLFHDGSSDGETGTSRERAPNRIYYRRRDKNWRVPGPTATSVILRKRDLEVPLRRRRRRQRRVLSLSRQDARLDRGTFSLAWQRGPDREEKSGARVTRLCARRAHTPSRCPSREISTRGSARAFRSSTFDVFRSR